MGSPAKSEYWNNPSLHCCAVIPTTFFRFSLVWWMWETKRAECLSQVFAHFVQTHSVSDAHSSDTVSLRGAKTPRTRMTQSVSSKNATFLHLTFHSHVSSTVLAVLAQVISTPRFRLHRVRRTGPDPKARCTSAEEIDCLTDPNHSTCYEP